MMDGQREILSVGPEACVVAENNRSLVKPCNYTGSAAGRGGGVLRGAVKRGGRVRTARQFDCFTRNSPVNFLSISIVQAIWCTYLNCCVSNNISSAKNKEIKNLSPRTLYCLEEDLVR